MHVTGVIPESVEFDALACIEARTAALGHFRDLGPLDMVQLTKLKQGTETSTYHYASGVDVSSSAAAAAHLNTLTFSLGETQVWFGSHRKWKIINGTYCAWNAFAKQDIRVKATIPGGVEEWMVAPNGHISDKVDERCWLETYMSAVVRAMLLVDDDAYFVDCSRRDDPFKSRADVLQFFHAFEALFGVGPVLGTNPRFQQPTLTTNLMVDTFYKVCQVSQMWDDAISTIESIASTVPEARKLLVQIYLMSNRENEAVKLAVETVRADPRDCEMLVQEAKLCLSKQLVDLALDCALRASSASPGQFYPWEALAQVYLKKEQYTDTLLALNSRPIVMPKPMDSVQLPAPRKVHSPLPNDGSIDEIWDLNTSKVDPVDPSLLKLSGGVLRGGAKYTYDLITQIYARVGWSELMRMRGEVFLMDGEKGGTAKRLCEQKLDGLFMTLWEDARVHSHWQREAIHFQSAQSPLNKTPLEWEILGCVAQRLHYNDEAIQAFELSLKGRFCHRVAWRMLDYYAPQDRPLVDASKALKLVVQLYAWNHRWHSEFSPRLRTTLNRIVASEGMAEVRMEIEATFAGQGIVAIMLNELAKVQLFSS